MDSGADCEFMDQELAKQLALKMVPLPSLLQVQALAGHVLHHAFHCTKSLLVTISKNDQEWMSFLLILLPFALVMLCFQWLQKHNLHLDWTRGHILE